MNHILPCSIEECKQGSARFPGASAPGPACGARQSQRANRRPDQALGRASRTFGTHCAPRHRREGGRLTPPQ